MKGDPRRNPSSDMTNVVQVCTKCVLWTYEKEGNSKYLRKSCYDCIKCIAATFLTAFMWRRPLNSAALATTTHRRLKWVSDGTGTQVGTQMINKCRIKMIQKKLYNVRDPPWEGDRKRREKKIVKQSKPFWYSRVIIISRFNLFGLKVY